MFFFNYTTLLKILKVTHLKKNLVSQLVPCDGAGDKVADFYTFDVNSFKSCFLSIQQRVNICNYNNHLSGNEDSSLFLICKFAYKTGATINDFNKWLSDPEFINNFRKEIIKYIAEKKEITFVGCDEVMFTINFSDYLLGAFILKIIVEKLHLTLLYNPYFFSVLNYTDSTTLGVNSIIAEKNVSEELSIEEHKRALCSCSCDPILPINPIEIESFPMGNHENSVLSEKNKELFFQLKEARKNTGIKKIEALSPLLEALNINNIKPHSISCAQDKSKVYPIVPYTKEGLLFIISEMLKIFPNSEEEISQHMLLQHKFLACLSYINFADIEYELYDKQEKYIDISFLVQDTKNITVLKNLQPYLYEINSDNLSNIKTVRFGISRTSYVDFEWSVNSFLKQYLLIVNSNKDVIKDLSDKFEK